jgi:hypothetical protein
MTSPGLARDYVTRLHAGRAKPRNVLQTEVGMLFLVSLLMQTKVLSGEAASANTPPAISVERVRRELERPPSTITVEPGHGDLPPVFRMQVHGNDLSFEHLWAPGPLPYVRPPRGLYHHEFLEQVMPEEFRAPMLYPCCPILPLVTFVKKKLANRSEAKTRLEVKKELKQFLDAQSEAKKD